MNYLNRMNDREPMFNNDQDRKAYRIAYLLAGYVRQTLTADEHEELVDWVTAGMDNQRLFEELSDRKNIEKWMAWKEKLPQQLALERVKKKLNIRSQKQRLRLSSILPWAVAAALFTGILATAVWIDHRENKVPAMRVPDDLLPGSNKALLELSDGSTRQLDNTIHGDLQREGNTQILISGQGQLSYELLGPAHTSIGWNRLSTPRGGQFRLSLPDGSKVWLNAASSIHYPIAFAGKERRVQLTGEAYFEIAKDPVHPFIVEFAPSAACKEPGEVRVVGTHFNVNAYHDEETIRVTLEEGAVLLKPPSVSGTGRELKLRPGEQAVIDVAGSVKTTAADLESTLAWKDGMFNFKQTPISDLMRQVARWYDCEVKIKVDTSEHFNAIIPRDVPVSRLLHYLEKTGSVHFVVENKKITVQ